MNHERGRDTSPALTEIRTVLKRAETALDRLSVPPDPADEDPDAHEMRIALAEVIELLEEWRRTGQPLKTGKASA